MKNKPDWHQLPITVLLFYFIIPLFFSCNHTTTSKINSPVNNPEPAPAEIKKPASGFPDTLIIHSPAAVFFNPDSLQLKKLKDILTNNEYETEVHNCFYLMRNARIQLKKYWPGISIIETSKHRYLLFVKADKETTLIDLDNKGDFCGIFLFDGKKEPQFSDMMNIDTDLGFYFKH